MLHHEPAPDMQEQWHTVHHLALIVHGWATQYMGGHKKVQQIVHRSHLITHDIHLVQHTIVVDELLHTARHGHLQQAAHATSSPLVWVKYTAIK